MNRPVYFIPSTAVVRAMRAKQVQAQAPKSTGERWVWVRDVLWWTVAPAGLGSVIGGLLSLVSV